MRKPLDLTNKNSILSRGNGVRRWEGRSMAQDLKEILKI
jgi:hypothetical protein